MKATVESETGFLRYTFEGDWDWEEFYQSIERGRTSNHKHSDDVILDFRGVSHISPDAVLHLKPAAQIVEANNRRYIVIARGSAIQTIFMLFIRIYSHLATRFYLVSTLEDAYALLSRPNPSLSPEIA